MKTLYKTEQEAFETVEKINEILREVGSNNTYNYYDSGRGYIVITDGSGVDAECYNPSDCKKFYREFVDIYKKEGYIIDASYCESLRDVTQIISPNRNNDNWGLPSYHLDKQGRVYKHPFFQEPRIKRSKFAYLTKHKIQED
jgi:hypothetical protein